MTKFFNSAMAALLISSTSIFAQVENDTEKPNSNPPISIETMAGSRGVMYQLIINKKFQSIPLGFFSVTNAAATWEKEMTPDIMTQAHLTYTLFKGLDISSGMQYTPVYGFRSVAGLIYSYVSPQMLIIVNPKVDLADDLAAESLALIEYRPKINDKLNFYSRLQGMYGFIPKSGIHNRSYIMLRAGIGYKEFAFGAASNIDWYGPIKHNENNFGVFVSALLF
ncbi:hypothetical protein [Flavobacterium sp. SORGH_AS_0622]|uniref:hypothetical protein n=1 Tax=Flavobacterium sp. SORGH_AS_0622 TaxID=3041772 RepID=UPI00277E85C5|nr:hypothetical protein [Flavobacterium sp. SORGH_AS_0622]MDQ1166456.1 hypothetical protein [Flavobacterium sp. SORGH_AS_0622]